PFAAPGLGIIAAAIMFGFGLWWLGRAEAAARHAGEGYGGEGYGGEGGEGYGGEGGEASTMAADDPRVRELATIAREFDPAEIRHGQVSKTPPPVALAALPLLVVIGVNLLMVVVVLPRLDTAFLAEERWG